MQPFQPWDAKKRIWMFSGKVPAISFMVIRFPTMPMPLFDHPHVGQIRGIGLMWAIEVVRDKKSLEPYPRKDKITERLAERLMDMGILIYKCTGFSNGDGDAIMLGPPFIISESEIDFSVQAIQQVINQL